MSKEEQLIKYKQNVEIIKQRGRALGMSDFEIEEMFSNCFEILEKRKIPNGKAEENVPKNKVKLSSTLGKVLVVFIFVIFGAYVLLNVHQPTSSLVLRNVQDFIYPGLKLLRYLSVPIVKKVPSLTELYEESCLLENPFFYVHDMECWPCENVHSVIDLTGFNNQSIYQSGVPYIVKTKQKPVMYSNIIDLYTNNSEVFIKDANRIKSSNKDLKTIEDLKSFSMNDSKSSDTHISWRINRMSPARLIRSLFPRPYFISEWSGQSIERYVMVDDAEAETYALPNFECSYVLMIQGSGERTIILKPSRECGQFCRTVSVVLKPSYVLWYNWWYWRPISLPVEHSRDPSISYITSYC